MQSALDEGSAERFAAGAVSGRDGQDEVIGAYVAEDDDSDELYEIADDKL